MAIGINWAEIWAPVWKAVWTQSPPAPQPTPVDATQTPAGSSNNRKNRRKQAKRLYVEIDGQSFPVASVAEATQVLQQARAIAERQAEQKAAVAEKRLKSKAKVPAVRVAAPVITVSPALLPDVRPLIEDITRLYERAAQLAEFRLLLARQQADEQDDEDVLLLI